MKHLNKIILGSLLLAGLQFGALTGCVGSASVGTGYYGGYYGGPWVHDDVVVVGGGRGFYGGDRGYVHPGGFRR
jgi:hypothetical protein